MYPPSVLGDVSTDALSNHESENKDYKASILVLVDYRLPSGKGSRYFASVRLLSPFYAKNIKMREDF
jgi:hypothetical protein